VGLPAVLIEVGRFDFGASALFCVWVAKTPSVHEAVNFQRLVAELLQLVFRPLTLSNDA
jgi:hypothetical protein